MNPKKRRRLAFFHFYFPFKCRSSEVMTSACGSLKCFPILSFFFPPSTLLKADFLDSLKLEQILTFVTILRRARQHGGD